MRNKPDLLDAQMNVSPFITKDYENKSNWKLGENKANTKPIKTNTNPIPEKPKMKLNSYSTKDYENKRLCRCGQNKLNQTQFLKIPHHF